MLKPDEKREVFTRVGYKPSDAQAAIHFDTSLVKLVAGGERGGKSRFGGAEIVGNAPDSRLIWIVGPDYEQARPEFMYALADLERLDAIERLSVPAQGQLQMWLRGGIRIVTKTGEEAMKLASEAPDGILMVEAAQQPYQNFEKLFARTAEARAHGEGWLTLIGTFEKALRWYADMFRLGSGPNLFGLRSFSLPTWSNLKAFPGGREDPALKAMEAALSPEVFRERFGGEPAPPAGVVFKEFSEPIHVVPIAFGNTQEPARTPEGWLLPSDSDLEVWVDPGYAGAYAVEFVSIHGGLVFLVDEVYAVGKVGQQVIMAAQAKRDLWERVRGGTMDIAGKQHQAMESQWELWQRLAGFALRMDAVPIVDGIQRHRTFLVDPFSMAPRIFHDPKCRGAIGEYGLYKYPDEKPNRDERELPIDANNHAMKAIAYGLVSRFGYVDGRKPRKQRGETELERLTREVKHKALSQSRDGWMA